MGLIHMSPITTKPILSKFLLTIETTLINLPKSANDKSFICTITMNLNCGYLLCKSVVTGVICRASKSIYLGSKKSLSNMYKLSLKIFFILFSKIGVATETAVAFFIKYLEKIILGIFTGESNLLKENVSTAKIIESNDLKIRRS